MADIKFKKIEYSIPFGDGEMVTGVVAGETWDDVVKNAKGQLAPVIGKKYGFLAKMWVKKASPLNFAKEIVSRYNKETYANDPLPASCEAFVKEWALPKNFVAIIEE